MMVQENNSLRLRIYSYNQKGRSAAYLLPDFIIGSTAYKTGEWHYQPPDGAAEKRTAQFAMIDGWKDGMMVGWRDDRMEAM